MKLKRTIHAVKVNEYNELATAVNEECVVIAIIGDLYDEIFEKAKEEKMVSTNKKLNKFIVTAGILTGGIGTVVAGIVLSIINSMCAHDFKDYDVKINERKKRIELYLKKGPEKYNSKYDTLFF